MNAQVPVIWHDYTGRIIAQSYIPSKRDIDYYKRDYPLAAHGVVADPVSVRIPPSRYCTPWCVCTHDSV